MSRLSVLANRLESGVLVINRISKILTDNLSREGSRPEPQLDILDSDALLRAVELISTQAYDDFCELMNDYVPAAGEDAQ